ncbi:hypothetical protein XA68_14678 [Ophiocordyceps unilateralis]|uniref:Uncharacterized protein n=1 Tax=Ophiocordyceps unilateralis TaxID=268505 RepID=A0A2A9P8E7_OPHUN|nr:hypothetical protein XA68_14678 [Ophiocordyceps unilateralis]
MKTRLPCQHCRGTISRDAADVISEAQNVLYAGGRRFRTTAKSLTRASVMRLDVRYALMEKCARRIPVGIFSFFPESNNPSRSLHSSVTTTGQVHENVFAFKESLLFVENNFSLRTKDQDPSELLGLENLFRERQPLKVLYLGFISLIASICW